MNTGEILKSGSNSEEDGVDVGQKIMIALVVLVITVGGYFVFRPSVPAQPVPEESTLQSASVFLPVTDGAQTYTLEGVDWVFEPQGSDDSGAPSTRVRLRLRGFQRNNKPIDIALYRLGTYRGECQSGTLVKGTGDASAPYALASAQCWWGENGRQLSVYQEEALLVVKIRSLTTDTNYRDDQVPILTIDLTKIIQPTH